MNKRKRDPYTEDTEDNILEKGYISFDGEIINPGHFVELLDKLINLDKFPEEIHDLLKYYYAKIVKSLKLTNKHDTKVFELEYFQKILKYDLNCFINNFNDINKSIYLLNIKIDLLKKKIKLYQNRLYSSINNVKELSKYLLSLNIDILKSIDNKEHLEKIIQEHSRPNFNIMFTNNNIQEDYSELRKLEDENSKYLDDLQRYILKFVDLKVEITSILNKYRDHRIKTREIHNIKCIIKESSVIQFFVKNQILKIINNKNHLKELLQNEYSNLCYFNNLNRNNGCKGCSNEKCKEMTKRLIHFNKCKNSNCVECDKTSKYYSLYNEYIKDE